MEKSYYLPIQAQYLPARLNGDYSKISDAKPAIQIIPAGSAKANPSNIQNALANQIFVKSENADVELSDFISGKVDVEKSQLQILLEQMEARHKIGYQIQSGILYRKLDVSNELSQSHPDIAGNMFSPKEYSSAKKRLDDLDKEQNMEYVALWRDTQKVLLEIMKHWSTHSTLERRSEVINSDL